jgi:hypothetical protein
MYADVDWSITPRPSYPADGRKCFDAYSQPPELKDRLQEKLGTPVKPKGHLMHLMNIDQQNLPVLTAYGSRYITN